eukprot:2684504-Pleurochrysis_carterae.AAC.1
MARVKELQPKDKDESEAFTYDAVMAYLGNGGLRGAGITSASFGDSWAARFKSACSGEPERERRGRTSVER